MSELDNLMSSVMGSAGFPKRVQLRTKFIDDIDALSKKGMSDEDIDIYLFKKLENEYPSEFYKKFGSISSEISNAEIIQKLNESSETDERKLQFSDRQIKNFNQNINKSKIGPNNQSNLNPLSRYSKFKYFLKATISGWIVWALLIITLNAINILDIYRKEDWLAWLLFPPIVFISIVIWVKKFILKN